MSDYKDSGESFKDLIARNRAKFQEECREWCESEGIEYSEEAFLQNRNEEARKRAAELDAEDERRRKEELRERSRTFRLEAFVHEVVPPIFREADINDFGKGLQPKIAKMLDGHSALILGDNGIGKTRLGWAILKAKVGRGEKVLYKKAQLLLFDIKSKDDPYSYAMRVYGSKDCLVVDEVDKIFESKADFIYFNFLVDRIYEQGRQIIVIGNGTKQQFIDSVGQSVYSRIRGNGGLDMELRGQDRRIATGG